MEKTRSYRVSLRNVVKKFGDNTVLDGIDLEIAPGSLTTLLGPSGCGKTTILRLIAGLELPTSGQIFLGDDDVSVLSASQRDVAMVFQSYALFPHMTVGENVGYGLKVQKVPPDERRGRVADALGSVGLEGFEDRFIDQMSGGQQQRVAVARALILEPHVMLFDEPLSNLDTKLRRQMRDDIRRLQQETGITSVYVTHDQSEALSVSDSVVVMKEGGIAQIGTPEELYRKPNSAFVATFMGDANILDAVLTYENAKASVVVEDATIPLGDIGDEFAAGKVKLAVRPEAIRLVANQGKTGLPTATIESRAYVGSAMEYTVSLNKHSLFVVMPSQEQEYAVGDKVQIDFNPVGTAIINEFEAG